MYGAVKGMLAAQLQEIREGGLFKDERIILSPQAASVTVGDGEVLNFCANNYLGLSSDAELIQAAKEALDQWGLGLSSVRFICGTQQIHKQLEAKVSSFLGFEDTILYTSCFDANGGLFETLLSADCAVISDALNHASIIDGVRLCKAQRYRYQNADMEDLETQLKAASSARIRLVVTDGVFSMDGTIAPLADVADLCDKYEALLMVDDSHATGFIGKTGRGTPEHCGVMGRVDILTSTLGKALGGSSGGFTCSHSEVVTTLRQRSRPYLFSNTVAPPIVAASIRVFDLISASTERRDKLEENTLYFREQMTAAGFDITPGIHPIVPIMLGDARLAQNIARDMLAEGIYVIGFSFPVVPKGQARIRVQLSAAHNRAHIDRALEAFSKVGKTHGVL